MSDVGTTAVILVGNFGCNVKKIVIHYIIMDGNFLKFLSWFNTVSKYDDNRQLILLQRINEYKNPCTSCSHYLPSFLPRYTQIGKEVFNYSNAKLSH